VITARFTSLPRKAAAVSFIFTSTMEEISSGEKVLVSFLYWTAGGQADRGKRDGQCTAWVQRKLQSNCGNSRCV
jgi:hypothetical protein